MLKELLMTEAKTIDASVALDSIFESVQLSPEAKANFSTVFEATVKKHAVSLAESHIEKIAEKAEEKVEEEKEKAKEEAREELKEAASKYFDHIAAEWMAENQLAVDRGIKADLFESMFVGMKELFVEHNVVIPEESVDVVAEMEEELAEQKAETARLFEEVSKRDAYINYTQREYAIQEATRELTDTQKEKVVSLTEGMDYSDAFSTKLKAIVEMVQGSVEQSVTESADINTIDKEADGLNFTTEAVEETPATKTPSVMDAYVAQAARLS